MRGRSGTRCRRLFALAACGLIVLNVLAYRHARAMLHFTRGGARTGKPEQLARGQRLRLLLTGVNVPRPVSARAPAELDPACVPLTLRGPDGVTLGAWYVDRGARTPLVVLFHGYAAEKSSLLPEARHFLAAGASVLLVDFRGCGDSSGDETTIGVAEARDVTAVVRQARASLPHAALILYGQSMGGAALLRAIRRDGVQPDAIIVEAVFDTLLHTVRNRFAAMGLPAFPCAELLVFWGGAQAGYNGFAHQPWRDAAAVTCPALFLHGAADPRARLEEGRRVCDAVRGPKAFQVFPAVGHESAAARFPVAWRDAVAGFLKQLPAKPALSSRRGLL